jgi:carbon-monoxide dehydrogenase large subunit
MKGRLEDDRMLTGRGRYVSDWNLPGQAYAYFIRSDRPHARILGIGKEEALKHPGAIAVITGADLVQAGLKPIPAAAPFKWQDGSDQRQAQRLSLAHEVVRHVGEPVAMVVAETAAQAQDAAEALAIDYEDLPAVMTAEQAMAPGAPQLHTTAPGNLVLDFVGGDEAATNAAFAKAAKVVKLTAYHSRVIGNPMEPRAAMGSYDPAKDLYFLHANNPRHHSLALFESPHPAGLVASEGPGDQGLATTGRAEATLGGRGRAQGEVGPALDGDVAHGRAIIAAGVPEVKRGRPWLPDLSARLARPEARPGCRDGARLRRPSRSGRARGPGSPGAEGSRARPGSRRGRR